MWTSHLCAAVIPSGQSPARRIPAAGGTVRYLTTFVSVLAAAGTVSAQSPPAELRFDVVSIKSVSTVPTGPGPRAPDLFSSPFITAHQLLTYAYDLPQYRVVRGPSWVTSEHFEVLAKASSPITREQRRLLVQQLLAERFRYTGRRESRELPTYDLVMARPDRRLGPNLKRGPVDCTPYLTGERSANEGPTIERAGRVIPRCGVSMAFGNGFVSPGLMGRTMPQLAAYLSAVTSRDVTDKTELSGVFDIELTLAQEPTTPGIGQLPRREAPALFTALQEQLGLKLVPSKAAVDVLVIDHIERPSEN
jgi:uncharacterized protein (TIGR03435 family)